MKSADKKYYMGITQGCAGIIKLGPDVPANFGGFYTDGIASCLGIVVCTGKKVSLFHYDYSQSDEQVKEMLTQEGAKITIVRNQAYWNGIKLMEPNEYKANIINFDGFKNLLNGIPVYWKEVTTHAMDNLCFSVNRDGEILCEKQSEDNIERHERKKALHAFNMVNAVVKKDIFKEQTDINIVFDNENENNGWIGSNFKFCSKLSMLKDFPTFINEFSKETQKDMKDSNFEHYLCEINEHINNHFILEQKVSQSDYSVHEEEKKQNEETENINNDFIGHSVYEGVKNQDLELFGQTKIDHQDTH